MQKLANDIEKLIIKEKYSPFAALEVLKKKYEIPFGWRTLYNYIYKKIFLKLRKKHLPYNKKYERHEEVEKRIKKNGGRSIEEMEQPISIHIVIVLMRGEAMRIIIDSFAVL